MTMISKHTVTAALASALLLFSVGACSKDKTEGTEGKDDGAGKTLPAKGSFAYLPKKSNLIVGVAPTQITASSMFKEIVEPMLKQQAASEYETIQESCLGSIESVIFGGESEQEDTMVVAIKGLDKAKVKTCAEASAKLSQESIEIGEDGTLTKVVSQGETAYIGWLGDDTMVMGTDAKAKAAVEAIVSRDEGLNEAMQALVGKTDTGASVWFAMQNPKPEEAGNMPYQIKSAQGSVSLVSGLKVAVGAEAVSPEEAKRMVEEFTTQLNQMKSQPPFGKFASKAEIKADGSQVSLTLALSSADVDELVPIVQQQVAPLMMMMMMSAGGGMQGGMMPGGDMGDMGDDMGAEDTAAE